MNNAGIKDLLDRGRFKPKHVSKALIDKGVPGNWECYQNVYNLIKGASVPKDAYVYIVLADLLDVDVRIVLSRYSALLNTVNNNHQDSEEDLF
jgi:hypothetical protein